MEVVEDKPEEVVEDKTEEVVEDNTEEVLENVKPKVKATPKASDRVDCNTCGKNLLYQNYRYRHEQICSAEPKPVKAQAKPKAKVKMMPKPKFNEVVYEEEIQEQPSLPKQVVKQPPKQQYPMYDITNHYQLLQKQFIQQKQEKYNNLCQNMFSTKIEKDNIIYNIRIMSLSLDGDISFINTEFIKLLNTGSSDLATVAYVDEQVASGGGGGNGSGGNGYTQAEVDTLLNNKLNVNNPQDIIGNLRLDPTNGNSKIILNAVSPPNATDDFYCNGNGQFNGSLRVSILTSTGDVNCDGVNADTFNSNVIANDIVFNHNDNGYTRYNATDDEIQVSKDIDVGSSTLISNNFDSGLNDVVFNLNSNQFLRFQLSDNTVRLPNTKSFLSQNIFTDDIKPLAFSNDVVFNEGNSTNDAYEEYMKLDASTETIN